jgi:hypothetical protein
MSKPAEAKKQPKKLRATAKIQTPELFEKYTDEYKDVCIEKQIPFTLVGLALHIGMDKATLNGYKDKEQFYKSYARAMAIAEADLLEAGFINKNNNGTFLTFLLKNHHGYRDKQDVVSDNTHKLIIEREIIKK